jgi:hypothetical protein
MRSRSRMLTGTVMSTFALAAAACAGGGDGGTNPPPPPTVASVGVSLAAASITVGQTTSATAVARDVQGAPIAGKTAILTSPNQGAPGRSPS